MRSRQHQGTHVIIAAATLQLQHPPRPKYTTAYSSKLAYDPCACLLPVCRLRFKQRHARERALLCGAVVGSDAASIAVPFVEALAGPAGVAAACSALVANTLAGGSTRADRLLIGCFSMAVSVRRVQCSTSLQRYAIPLLFYAFLARANSYLLLLLLLLLCSVCWLVPADRICWPCFP
jgi:hypothetical protein